MNIYECSCYYIHFVTVREKLLGVQEIGLQAADNESVFLIMEILETEVGIMGRPMGR